MNEAIKNHGRHFAEKVHRETNHKYDDILPYEYHLRMVVDVGENFVHLLPKDDRVLASVFAALWCHDSIEDCRVTYNDLRKQFGEMTAEIVFALTNNKGRNRKERANSAYYQGIRETPYAIFGKLCDRIANVKFGVTFGGKVDMYRQEQKVFEEGLNGKPLNVTSDYSDELFPFHSMVEYLRNLLNG
jgi:(p)ppGpp synthase/HD superfamily hydrolase